jgi:RNA-directed DNA polymerase
LSLTLKGTAEDLRRAFFALASRDDIARLLDLPLSQLTYHLYRTDPAKRYVQFPITKKSGGVRIITAPATSLKIIQRKLNQVLQHVYKCKPAVHGFTLGKGIVTNAQLHKRARFILNIDLEDFFPSINFGRVRGMFMAPPYRLNEAASTVLAQICCFNNQLPQGGPTSPIISNMICARMDSQLQTLAKNHHCTYTRYADDMTFSTHRRTFPQALARIAKTSAGEQLEIGGDLQTIVKSNGFKINQAKVRLQTPNRRQQVTGLTVNRFPNVQRTFIRQIRAMLHAWRKFGLDAAEQEHLRRFNKKHRHPGASPPSFKKVVKGKIDFVGLVRGKGDRIFLRFLRQYGDLDPDSKPRVDRAIHQQVIEADAARKRRLVLLAELKEQFVNLTTTEDRPAAGLALEKVLNRLFTLSELEPRKPFRVVGEQIDGSFELDHETYLLEAKWEKGPLPAEPLYTFREKIEGKSLQTRGVLISISGISKQAEDAIIRGKVARFFVVNGKDLEAVLNEEIELSAFLRQRQRLLAEEGQVVVPYENLRTGTRDH